MDPSLTSKVVRFHLRVQRCWKGRTRPVSGIACIVSGIRRWPRVRAQKRPPSMSSALTPGSRSGPGLAPARPRPGLGPEPARPGTGPGSARLHRATPAAILWLARLWEQPTASLWRLALRLLLGSGT